MAELGCTLVRSRLSLPQLADVPAGYAFLTQYLERNLTLVNPISEISRREILIAPTLREVCAATEAQPNHTSLLNPEIADVGLTRFDRLE